MNLKLNFKALAIKIEYLINFQVFNQAKNNLRKFKKKKSKFQMFINSLKFVWKNENETLYRK